MQAISEQFLQSINCFKDQTKFGSIKFLILQSLCCAKSTTNGYENSFMPLRKQRWGRGSGGGGPESLRKHLVGNFCTIAQVFFLCAPESQIWKSSKRPTKIGTTSKTYFNRKPYDERLQKDQLCKIGKQPGKNVLFCIEAEDTRVH